MVGLWMWRLLRCIVCIAYAFADDGCEAGLRRTLALYPYVMDLELDSAKLIEARKSLKASVARCRGLPREWDYQKVVLLAIKEQYNTYSNIVKDQLARISHQVKNLSLEETAPWTLEPLSSLLDFGIKPSSQALCLATKLGLKETVRLLLRKGAKPEEHCNYMTPFHIAAAAADQSLLRLLGDYPPNLLDTFGRNVSYLLEPPILLHNDTCSRQKNSYASAGWRTHEVKVHQDHCSVPRVSAKNLSFDIFIRDYVSAQRPLIVTDATDHWPIFAKTARTTLLENHGEATVRVAPIPYADVFGEQSTFYTMNNYITRYLDNIIHEKRTLRPPLYVFDHTFISNHLNASYTLPTFFEDSLKPNSMIEQFILGPHDSGSPMHYHCAAVNTVLHGTKRWFLLPPSKAYYSKQHPLHDPVIKLATSILNTVEDGAMPEYLDVCTQQAGEMLFVPDRYGHATLNNGECLAIAVEFDSGMC